MSRLRRKYTQRRLVTLVIPEGMIPLPPTISLVPQRGKAVKPHPLSLPGMLLAAMLGHFTGRRRAA